MMQRRFFTRCSVFLGSLLAFGALTVGTPAQAEDEAPDAMILRLSNDMLDTIRADKAVKAGDINRIMHLVDTQIMPNVNFQRMTASAVGPSWRQASPEQKTRLLDEFKYLLVRTYAGALTQVTDQKVVLKPLRGTAQDNEVIVKTEVRGKGDPIQLDYRMEKTAGQGLGWKIYDLNVMGMWLVDNYRGQFKQEISAKGLDGLINTLSERNKANAAKKG